MAGSSCCRKATLEAGSVCEEPPRYVTLDPHRQLLHRIEGRCCDVGECVDRRVECRSDSIALASVDEGYPDGSRLKSAWSRSNSSRGDDIGNYEV